MWRTVATTGMRRGELCGLQWKHIDLKHSTIRVRQARVVADAKVVLTTPKTKRGRRAIPVGAVTLAALESWRDAQRPTELPALGDAQSPDTYLFTDKAGEPLNPEVVTERFNRQQLALRAET